MTYSKQLIILLQQININILVVDETISSDSVCFILKL